MEYERIHKVQAGVMSPSKLRIILGAHQQKRKPPGTSSSRTSPSKSTFTEFASCSLLDNDAVDNDVTNLSDGVTAPCFGVSTSVKNLVFSGQVDQSLSSLAPNLVDPSSKCDHAKSQDAPQLGTSATTAPNVRLATEDNGGGMGGGASSSSTTFEFHKGERVFTGPPFTGPFSRPIPSKWNDAEKWIMCRQKPQPPNALKRSDPLNQGARATVNTGGRVAPEAILTEQRCCTLQGAGCGNRKENPFQSSFLNVVEKFSFSSTANGSAQFKDVVADQKDVNQVPQTSTSGNPCVKSVCMRDIGTEMTPVASQDPSRTGTPIGAASPCRSFASSKAASPKRGSPAPSPVKVASVVPENSGAYELSEQEVRIKIRKEIVALGLKLGKANIAAWASKDDMEDLAPSRRNTCIDKAKKKSEYEARANAWEEAEETKYMARLEREEAKLRAWENHQKAKLEAELRAEEIKLEKLRADAQERMMRRLARTKQRSESKLAAIEARKNRQAAATAKRVQRIRRTGSTSSSNLLCCSGFF